MCVKAIASNAEEGSQRARGDGRADIVLALEAPGRQRVGGTDPQARKCPGGHQILFVLIHTESIIDLQRAFLEESFGACATPARQGQSTHARRFGCAVCSQAAGVAHCTG